MIIIKIESWQLKKPLTTFIPLSILKKKWIKILETMKLKIPTNHWINSASTYKCLKIWIKLCDGEILLLKN